MSKEPQFKQEFYCELINTDVHQTVITHKFKQGDIVRIKKKFVQYYGTLEFTVDGIEFSKENNTSEWRIMYQSPEHRVWIGEHKLELVERKEDDI